MAILPPLTEGGGGGVRGLNVLAPTGATEDTGASADRGAEDTPWEDVELPPTQKKSLLLLTSGERKYHAKGISKIM